ncbi:double zinc ribbon domain-containing protein [Sulfitobacter aestuariivivens]|uniref:ComF family protein n=1 Tax=Sulfitobacter aestuariivivens TaxID=2766981 RepID=A0A927D7L0_9RHOB|nr:double zinc ribbon domain-containing protein [Sulfitobacter aestuariivivens]MBD3665264.1 ComF family protein [Sulfitobacter aestuariivivens]
MLAKGIQTALSAVYPARCLTCGAMVDSDFGLCGPCWRDTGFIGGTICDCCGVPLPGEHHGDTPHCDACMTAPRSWEQGRAALLYRDTGRKLVLALKHGDRQEIAKPAALWMASALRDCLPPQTLIAPVPLHWTRMIKRRYNQSALLAKALAAHLDLPWCPDLLQRTKPTRALDGLGGRDRHETLRGAIRAHPKRWHRLVGRPLLLVDDVMTSGATLSAATQAAQQAGSGPVRVVTLARVAKET